MKDRLGAARFPVRFLFVALTIRGSAAAGDTLLRDAQKPQLPCRKVGNHRIMRGSHYPFDMGVDHPLRQLDGVKLSADDRDNILFETAHEFLRPATSRESSADRLAVPGELLREPRGGSAFRTTARMAAR